PNLPLSSTPHALSTSVHHISSLSLGSAQSAAPIVDAHAARQLPPHSLPQPQPLVDQSVSLAAAFLPQAPPGRSLGTSDVHTLAGSPYTVPAPSPSLAQVPQLPPPPAVGSRSL